MQNNDCGYQAKLTPDNKPFQYCSNCGRYNDRQTATCMYCPAVQQPQLPVKESV